MKGAESLEAPTDQPSALLYVGFTGATSQSGLGSQALLKINLGSASFLADGYGPGSPQDRSLCTWLTPLPFSPKDQRLAAGLQKKTGNLISKTGEVSKPLNFYQNIKFHECSTPPEKNPKPLTLLQTWRCQNFSGWGHGKYHFLWKPHNWGNFLPVASHISTMAVRELKSLSMGCRTRAICPLMTWELIASSDLSFRLHKSSLAKQCECQCCSSF